MTEPAAPVKPQVEVEPEVVERYVPIPAFEYPHRVIIHNDDITTFEFVIAILVMIFKQTRSVPAKLHWKLIQTA